MGNQGNKGAAGYQYLLVYKLDVAIYDLTVEFVQRWIKSLRTKDQMEQAARSTMQNIPEGNKQQSLKGYIRLSGVSRGSAEELLNDYYSFARQNKIGVWGKDKAIREIGEIREIWGVIRRFSILPDTPNFPNLPYSKEKAVNLMITLVNQSNYLTDKLIVSLKEKHRLEGGLSEKLYRERKKQRGY